MNTKAICPNCGAEGTAGRFCEYCGTKIPMPKPKRKKKSNSDSDEEKRIFEFQTSEEDAIQKMLYQLTEKENLPKDFFQNCKVDEVKPYYVPVYYYQCSFEAPWSCVKLVTREYEVYNRSTGRNEKKKTTERYPMNGVAMDSFTYITCAGRKEDLPKELYEFINTEMITKGASYYDNSEVRELTGEESSILVENGGFSSDVLWRQNCDALFDARVSRTVRSQLPDRYEDLSYSYSYNNPSWDMILPFWVVYYSYNGKKFIFVTDGLVKTTKLNSPVDEKQASESEAIKKDLAQKSSKSGWSIFYFILFSLATLITSVFLTEENVSLWCILLSIAFMLLTFINGSMTKKRLKEKKKAQAVQTKNQNETWLQRKEQLSSTLTHNGFGMTDSKTKELLSTIKREVERKDMSVDSKTNYLWVKIITGIVLIIWVITLPKGIRSFSERVQEERKAKKEAVEKANQEKEAKEAKEYAMSIFQNELQKIAKTDLQKLALPNNIKEIKENGKRDTIIYKFDFNGNLTSIENNKDHEIFNFIDGNLISSSREEHNKIIVRKYIAERNIITDRYTLYSTQEGKSHKKYETSFSLDEYGRISSFIHVIHNMSYDDKNRAKVRYGYEYIDGYILPISEFTPYPLFVPADMSRFEFVIKDGNIVQISKDIEGKEILYTFGYWDKQTIEQEQQRISIQNEMKIVDDSVAVASPADSLAAD